MGKLDQIKQIAALNKCPYCSKRREEVMAHSSNGHPVEEVTE